VFWVAVLGRVREIDAFRSHVDIQSPSNQPGGPLSTGVHSRRPGAAVQPRAPAMFYQAPRRDFFHETSAGAHPADYAAPHAGRRPYVSRFTVPPRY